LVDYPEHEKLDKVEDKSQVIGEFLDWLRSTRIFLCRYGKREIPYPIGETIEEILAAYFGIDLEKLEQEKQAMLEEMRKANQR